MKDWTGNNKSTYITLGASNHTDKERESNDYYATDPVAIDGLVASIGDMLPYKVWECACGEGHLSERLKSFGFDVVSTDLMNRGYGEVKDFLSVDRMPDDCKCIITNPPYKHALVFIRHALDLLPDGGLCVMFLKTTFLEGLQRYKMLYKNNNPELVLQFSRRVLCAKNGDFEGMRKGGGSAVAYAWYVFRKGHKGDTIIKWI